MGESGVGKSTLLNLIAGIDQPTSGKVEVAGTNVGTLSEGALAKWRSRNVGFIFQFYNLIPVLTAVENSPKEAGSPVSETPNQTFLPRGSSRPALAVAERASASRATASRSQGERRTSERRAIGMGGTIGRRGCAAATPRQQPL